MLFKLLDEVMKSLLYAIDWTFAVIFDSSDYNDLADTR